MPHLSINIETAWSFPKEGICLWSKAAPTLTFTCTTREESEAFAGAAIAIAGEIYEDFFDPQEVVDSSEHLLVDSSDEEVIFDGEDEEYDFFSHWEMVAQIVGSELDNRLDKLRKYVSSIKE